jgi:prevent-host-death family protein
MATLPKYLSSPLPTKAKRQVTRNARNARLLKDKSMSASSAKTHLLKLLDTVDRTREGIIITKRGRPIAKLIPVETKDFGSIFGCMKGTFRIKGDIVGSEPDVWEAML